jgi:hypothetical protein
LEPAADLYGAMTAAIEGLAAEGWQIEDEPRFGFVFIRPAGERRLPYAHAARSARYAAAVVQPVQLV